MAQTDKFIATLALERPTEVSTEALVAKMEALFPILRGRVTSLGKEASTPGSNLLRIDETILTVIPVAAPAPPDAFEVAIKTDKLWPEAEVELSRHQAVVIVSHLGRFNDFAGAQNAAICVTMVVTAMLDLTPSIGLYWHAAETVVPTARAREQGLALGRGDLPLEIWTKMLWFRGPPDKTSTKISVGVLTVGLEAFVGRDLELPASDAEPSTTARRAIDLSTYLLQHGPVLKDGETTGMSDGETLQVRYGTTSFCSPPRAVIQARSKSTY
jgi:hypothetical protein